MAKVKNKRNFGLADKVQKKKNAESFKKKLNPFEVHINREKIKVLGKKSKHDRGLPGVSRAKAIQKRKETLGTEMKLMNKTNTFIDRRIGEKDGQLTAEDRMIARFAAERARQHTKKNIYNLADDEVLTHRGQTLEQIEKFDDPRSDDEEEEGKGFGGLGDDFVSEGHFGGGMLSKTSSKDGAKSHKDLIEQLIAESKKRKAEKQKEKEQTLDLTEKLDSEWKDLQPVVFKKAKVAEESIIDKVLKQSEKNSEDYDKAMRELKFERRGTPSDGLKNEEKQKKEELENLKKLEKERQLRMEPDEEIFPRKANTSQPKHRSADDLDDNFDLDNEQQFMLAYDKEGKPLVPKHVLETYSVPNSKPKYDDGVSSSDDDDDDNGDEEEDNNDEEEDSDDEVEDNDDKEEDNDDEEESEIKDINKKSSNSMLNSSNKIKTNDKAISESSNDDDVDDDTKLNNSLKPNKVILEVDIKTKNTTLDKPNKMKEKLSIAKTIPSTADSNNDSTDEAETDTDIKDGGKNDNYDDFRHSDIESEDEKEIINSVKENIGSFFDNNDELGTNLKELLKNKTPKEQYIALQGLIKSYDPSLAENNKDLLSKLFAHLLQYISDIFSNSKDGNQLKNSFQTFDKIVPILYDLTHTIKVSTKKLFIELLTEKRKEFLNNPKRIPDLDTLIFFKLVSLLYPTSDFRHPVTIPSLLFMSDILMSCKFNDAFSVSRGLFLATLILEFTALSKRYVPAALNFLRGILFLVSNTSILNPIPLVPPFRLHKTNKILKLEEDCCSLKPSMKMCINDFVLKEIDNDFKIRFLQNSVLILKEFFNNYNEIEAQEYLFESHLKLLARIDKDLYPSKVVNIINEVEQHMTDYLKTKTYIRLHAEKKKPKALRMYEPDVMEVFTGSKSTNLSREMAESARLKHKVKKEMKGALREIRRDKAYIASVKIKQKIQSDTVRKEKVKQIYKDASIQQGELNKIKRGK